MKKGLLLVLLCTVLTLGFGGCSKADKAITGRDDLKNSKIGVMTGTTGEHFAFGNFPQTNVKSFDDVMDAVAALKAGQLDAIITAYPTAVQLTKKNADLQRLPDRLTTENTSVALRKGDERLLAELNRIIADLKRDGTLADMDKRWFKEDLSPYEERNLALPQEGKTLKVGVSATREPLNFVDKNGRVTGHDGELARLIGIKLSRPVEFVNMKFMALIPALQSGKVDLIISGMTATDERKKTVHFTQPYFTNAQVLVVKKTKAALTTGPSEAGPQASRPPSAFKEIISGFHSNILHENRFLLIIDGLKTTIIISVCASLTGTLVGALVCFMRMSRKAALQIPARIYISILRGTPVLVVLMLIFYVVFASVSIDPVIVAVIAFGMNFAAYVAEIFRSGIESIDKGQTEAGIALGFTRVRTFLHIILPQMVQRVLPVYKGECISLVKMTSIVGYIAVQDLTKAGDIIRSRTFDAFFPLVMVAVLYFMLSWLLLQALEYAERTYDPKRKNRKARAA